MTPEQKIADAIRKVTIAVQNAIEEGHRSSMIEADDLVDVLLAIADELDPPLATLVASEFACPNCGERRDDQLVWHADIVRCSGCGTEYVPG
jgi:hypothetical protein